MALPPLIIPAALTPTVTVFVPVVIIPLVKVSVPVSDTPWLPRITPPARLIVRLVIIGAAVKRPLGKVNDAAFVPKLSEEVVAVVIVPEVCTIVPFIVRRLEPKLNIPAELLSVKAPPIVMSPPAVFVKLPERVRLL